MTENTEKRNRWIINVVVVLALFSFVGILVPQIISMSSLIGSFFQGSQPPATASSPSPTASASPTARKEELAAQAKGYELVLQREPENQTALRGLLEARLGLGDVKGAITPLEKLAKLNPKETYYSVLLAQAKQQLGDREGAAQTYRSILAAQPGDMLALQGLVGLLVEQKRPEAAIGLLQDTLKTATQANQVQPNSVDVASVQVLLGGVYASQKRYDEAIAIYDEAAKTSKQDFRPIYGKAVLFKEQGKTEEAKPLFTKAAELAPAKYKDLINQVSSSAAPGSTAPATVPGVSPSQTAPVPGQPAPVTSP